MLYKMQAPQSEMYMKWILIIQAFLNKFTSEIPSYKWMKTCWNAAVSQQENTIITQKHWLAVSGKQQIVTCFNLHAMYLWEKLIIKLVSLTSPVLRHLLRESLLRTTCMPLSCNKIFNSLKCFYSSIFKLSAYVTAGTTYDI